MDKKIIVKRIEELMKERGVTAYQLKENADISTFYQWKKNPKRDKEVVPSLRSIERICNYFEVSLSYFFAFDKQEQEDIKMKELMGKIRSLDGSQIKIIEALVKQFNKIPKE